MAEDTAWPIKATAPSLQRCFGPLLGDSSREGIAYFGGIKSASVNCLSRRCLTVIEKPARP